MKYIPRCIFVDGGKELEVLEIEEADIFDTKEQAEFRARWWCKV